MLQFLNYSGNKKYFIDQFRTIIDGYKFNNYYELFCGSSILLFNAAKHIENKTINDSDKNLIDIYLSFKNFDYNVYKDVVEKIKSDFGDIKEKVAYYKFRDYFNKNLFNSDDPIKGFYSHALANACTSSMMRFGQNGFNQGCGKRSKVLFEFDYNRVHDTLLKTELYNIDYSLVPITSGKGTLIFIDPPYLSVSNDTYNRVWDERNLEKLLFYIKMIDSHGCKFVYTDIKNEINTSMLSSFRMIKINRLFVNMSPSVKDRKTDHSEVIFTNIDNTALNIDD